MKGYVQVYTGSEGDSTLAAIGLALRAAGAGLHVFIGQFIDSWHNSEVLALKRWSDRIVIEQFGIQAMPDRQLSKADFEAAASGLKRISTVISASIYHLVILADANLAVSLGLFSADALLRIVKMRPLNTEVIITGRDARPEIIAQADLVTELRAI